MSASTLHSKFKFLSSGDDDTWALTVHRTRADILHAFYSRPTAVNLSDAATKLTEVIEKAAASASEANTVFQVVIHVLYALKIGLFFMWYTSSLEFTERRIRRNLRYS